MSDYHILTQGQKRKSVNVVFHIPVPGAGTNQAGLSWRDAVVREQGGSVNIVSVLGTDIDPTEDTQLKAGELVEHQVIVRFSSINLTNAQRKAEIEGHYATSKNDLIAEKQITLEWIGFSANTP